ncbi:MAG: Gfo/Idh/MocA family oxidoreductase [Thermoproteales archaeon]|nr:Gfo/Idh/MocA family oxidoreductase [Thermoproteales archaeon]
MVYRVGIVGCDNSHAVTFGKMFNDPTNEKYVDGFKVTHVYDPDRAKAKDVASKVCIENIVDTINDMINKIDIVFIEFRDGALHLKYAKPFIDAEIPLFIDKPLAANPVDAEKIVSLAKKKNVLLTSFSVLRFCDEVLAVKNKETIRLGVNGPGDPDSQYSGLIFYGIHVAEIINTITGTKLNNVYAIRKGKTVSALIWGEDLPLVDARISNDVPYTFSLEIFAKDSVNYLKISDFQECYRRGLIKIREMLNNGKWPISDEDLIYPVKLVDAIDRSYKSNKIIKI